MIDSIHREIGTGVPVHENVLPPKLRWFISRRQFPRLGAFEVYYGNKVKSRDLHSLDHIFQDLEEPLAQHPAGHSQAICRHEVSPRRQGAGRRLNPRYYTPL